MTGKTRYFLVGSALVFFVGLSIGLVAYYGGMPQGLFASNSGPAELKFVPEDAAVVAYANVKQVMSSDLRQRLRQFGGPTDEGRNEFKTATGIDIENDIEYVVAFMGKRQADAAANSINGLVLARGQFDQGRLEAFAREKGATIEDYKGKRLIKPSVNDDKLGNKHERDLALAFLDKGLVAIGGDAMIRRLIDGAGASSKTARDNAEMMKLIADQRDASMWAVGQFEAISSQAKLPQEVTDRIPPITWFAASGHVNGGVQVMVKAETKTDEAATNLRDIVRGFVALAKMQAGNRPEAQALWPNVEMGGTGKTVSLSFGVSTQLIDAMTPKKRDSGGTPKPAAPKKPETSEKPAK
ncbi:MAG: hypothetical protein NT151_07260 [Acidobacteria bacterium]|nr:hypothetical protein [Acidobacteriota bacterium]